MSKRFGRNQKREMRGRIRELEKDLGYWRPRVKIHKTPLLDINLSLRLSSETLLHTANVEALIETVARGVYFELLQYARPYRPHKDPTP